MLKMLYEDAHAEEDADKYNPGQEVNEDAEDVDVDEDVEDVDDDPDQEER